MARFIGTETEYGISTPSQPGLSPIITSTHLVVAYASARGFGEHRVRWDFAHESPLRDSRGFDLRRYHTVPEVDAHALGVANVFATNGARFYVDHAHPEYSAPETTNAWDAMIYDAVGDHILLQAVADTAAFTDQGVSVLDNHEPCPPLKIYKNNVDGKGASYGSHENYRYARSTDFTRLAAALIPFFVARQVIIGAGRVGLGQHGEKPGFQISQRADYIEQEISLETTLNRGIINTRDEPHTDADNWGRLHVIIGDANMSQTSNLLKLGMTSLVLDAIEAGADFSDLSLVDAVAEVSRVSHDLSCTHRLKLIDGRALSALDLLEEYRHRVLDTVTPTDVDKRVLDLWGEVIGLLREDPLATSHLLDWTAKLSLVNSFTARGLSIDDAKIKLLDLQYTDIDPTRSLYHALVAKGRMKELVPRTEIERAVETPPADTRAFFRGQMISRFAPAIVAAAWESVVVKNSADDQLRIHTSDLGGLTQQQVGQPLEQSDSIDALLSALRESDATPISRL